MIIGLVRESVLQCFCHTCRAPLPAAVQRNQEYTSLAKTLPKTAQPKKLQFVTTEVRCQEKTKGGLCYEVILGEPDFKATPPRRTSSPPNKPTSVEDIEGKLRAAEERRQQLESCKVAAWSAKMQKIEDASRKKDQQTSQFIANTKDALEQKMGNHEGKREAYLTDLKSKLKDHIVTVEKNRCSFEQQTQEVKTAIEEKLKSASAQREENMKKMLIRLKEHNTKPIEIKLKTTIVDEKLSDTVTAQIETKLSVAEQKREKELQNKIETAKKYNERMLEIKQKLEKLETAKTAEKSNQIETKLTTAEINREKKIQQKVESIREKERRAETVRQNKANLAADQQQQQVTASSG